MTNVLLTDSRLLVSNVSEEDDYPTDNTDCHYEQMEYLNAKFFLVVVFGGSLCIIGLMANCFLLRILVKTCWKDSYCIYLISLACVDFGILITYVLVMCVEILYDYLQSVLLYRLWLLYVPYLFTMSRIFTMAATYIVLIFSTERYLSVLHFSNKFITERITHNKRRAIIFLILLFTVSFRLVSFWELQVVHEKNCTGFSEYQLMQTSMAQHKGYKKIYNLFMVQTVQTFLPFISLVVVNFLIIGQWHEIVRKGSKAVFRRDSLYQKFGTSTKGLCTARRTMIALISSYLMCNSLNVLITIWEDLDRDYLSDHFDFYTFVADLVSLLTAFNSATRLPIYYACNRKVRKQLESFCAQYNIDLKSRFSRVSSSANESLPLKCTTNDNKYLTDGQTTKTTINGWLKYRETRLSSD